VGAGGGVGVHMVQMARLCGGRVLAIDVGAEKLAMTKELGADATVDAATTPTGFSMRWPGRGAWGARGHRLGGDRHDAAKVPRQLGACGTAGHRGNRPKAVFKADPSFSVDPGMMLYRGLEIHGSRYVSMAELQQTLEVVRQGRVRPIVTQTFPLEGAGEALRRVEDGRVVGRACAPPRLMFVIVSRQHAKVAKA